MLKKLSHKIKKNLLKVFVICLFKLLIIFNFKWNTKYYKQKERETSEEKIINKRGKTNGRTNSDLLISMKDARKDARKDDDWYTTISIQLK